jgi:trigger factor
MQVTVERPQPCEAVLTVEVDDQQMEQAKDKAYREYAKYVKVPGFRPGKAPRQVLEKLLDADTVKDRARELVIGIAYPAALKESDLTPFEQGTVNEITDEEDKPLSFKAVVPLRPEVELGDYTELTAKKPVVTVGEEDVDREIEGILRSHGRLQPTPEAAADDDVVFADMDTAADGEQIGATRSTTFQVGQNMTEIDDALRGAQAGDTRECDVSYPEDFADAAMAGKTVHFTFRVNHVLRRSIPEATDEWAAEHTPADSVEGLRGLIRASLEQNAERAVEQEVRRQLLAQVAEKSQVHFPTSLVDQEVANDLRALRSNLEERESDIERYLEQTGKTLPELQDEMALVAKQRITNGLVMGRLAQVEHLELTKDELNAEVARIAEENALKPSEVRRRLKDEGQLAMVEERLLQDKLFAFLKGRATITDEAAPTAE